MVDAMVMAGVDIGVHKNSKIYGWKDGLLYQATQRHRNKVK